MERYYDRDGYPIRQSAAPAWAMVAVMVIAVAAFVLWLAPGILQAPGPQSAIGNQAPPSAVRRITTSAPPISASQPAPLSGVANSPEEADRLYQAAVEAQNAVHPAPAPLPLNSAGQPVISQDQQVQQARSLQLAEQEGAQAADQQLQAQRADANADALSRAPDVSYADAKALLGRDPCHVPRANPATCAQGLYKPTPVN